MIDPNLRAKDRIYSNLNPELKKLMLESLLSEEEHLKILEDIKETSYNGKRPMKNPKFTIVLGQTGSGKSNVTSSIYQEDDNIVIIDSDKYKSFRSDNAELLEKHLVEYAYLTAPDAYLHRDEMITDAMNKKYNILLEVAPSQKDGLFVDIKDLIRHGYKVEINTIGVCSLNSLLSVHERYEARIKLNDPTAKLTSLERHDDSFISLEKSIRNVQNINGVVLKVYQRGQKYPFIPTLEYNSESGERRFSCAVEALRYVQARDQESMLATFENRFEIVKKQMENRKAPQQQLEQLEMVFKKYQDLQPQTQVAL